jgi:hypothetical protein
MVWKLPSIIFHEINFPNTVQDQNEGGNDTQRGRYPNGQSFVGSGDDVLLDQTENVCHKK